jgi:hypothetical protein
MYYAKQVSSDGWHVINPEGDPITDNAPYGQDRVLVFRDEDAALERVEMCNDALDLGGVL